MIMSRKLTAERIDEIKNFPIDFDDDIPEFNAEQLAGFKPGLPRYKKTDDAMSVSLDTDVWKALEASGRISTAQINSLIRKALKDEKILA